MGLQLRIRHALGARMIEIPGRGGDNPIRVGRDASCDVPIPSGQVGPVHCLLYMHEGHWIVASAGPAVFVNGQEIAEPQFLEFGDRISLGTGPSAAVIEVDPVGAARQAATSAPPPSSRPSAPSERGSEAVPAYEPSSNGGWTPGQAAGADPAEAWQGQGEGSDADEYINLQAAAGALAPRHRPRRRVNNQSNAGLVAGLVVAVLVVGVLVIYMVTKQDSKDERQPTIVKPAPVVMPTIDLGPTKKPRANIFDAPKTRPAANPDGQASQAMAATSNADGDAVAKPVQTDPLKQTDEWQNIEQMRSSLDTAGAIWVFDEYIRRHPGQFEEELKKDIEASLDRLWWERVKKLMDDKKECQAETEKKKSDLLDEKPDSEFIKTLEKDIENLKFRVQSIDEMLRADMAFASDQTPNLFDEAQLAVLRGQRDKATFEKWSKRVMDHIRTHNGKPPWQR